MLKASITTLSVLAAGLAFTACSSEDGTNTNNPEAGTVGFHLTTDGVVLTSVDFDLNTAAGADVKAGDIPVPNNSSVIDGFIGAVDPGDYSLVLSATGDYNGESVECVTSAAEFSVAANEDVVLSAFDLVCTRYQDGADETGSIAFSAGVSVQVIDVAVDIVDTFSVAPVTIVAEGGVYPPSNLMVDASTGVTYSWSSSLNGAFAFDDATNTVGTYTCAEDGAHVLTITATLADGTSASKTATVDCSGLGYVPFCGNGIQDDGEACDDGNDVDDDACSNACEINVPPVCGDGNQDAGEGCDDGNLLDGDGCDSECQVEVVSIVDACFECFLADAQAGALAQSCVDDADCYAVASCSIEADCVSGGQAAATCLCGESDFDSCEQSFAAQTGPCSAQIAAATGESVAADNFFAISSISNGSGVAYQLLQGAQSLDVCVQECGLDAF